MRKPSGIHVMFLDLKYCLEPGKTVEATPQFDIEFPLSAIGASRLLVRAQAAAP
jgi:hypothetical protein